MDAFSRQKDVEYRRILWELASKMNEKDARHLAFLYSIKDWTDSLNVLETLDTQSVLSSTNLEGLRKVTQDLGRKELVRWLEAKIQCLCLLSTPNTQHTACNYYCNPQLKSHFESILPLNSLLISHTKILRNILESILPANASSRGTDTIKHYVQNAERKFREAEQDLTFACKKVGYWRSGDKLEPYPQNIPAKTKPKKMPGVAVQFAYMQPNQSYVPVCQETTRDANEDTSSNEYEEIDDIEEQTEQRVQSTMATNGQHPLLPAKPETTATHVNEEDSSDEDDMVENVAVWLQPPNSNPHEAKPVTKGRASLSSLTVADQINMYQQPTHSEKGNQQHEEECGEDCLDTPDCTGDTGYSGFGASHMILPLYAYYPSQEQPSHRHNIPSGPPCYADTVLERSWETNSYSKRLSMK